MSPLAEPTRLTLAKGQPIPNDPYFAFNSLLLHGNGTNGSTVITDSSGSPKTVTAVGNAQISTAQSKFGGASIAFDGTGDVAWGQIKDSDFEYSSSGAATIEAWIYPVSVTGGRCICSYYWYQDGGAETGWVFRVANGVLQFVNARFAIVVSGGSITINSWQHVAAVLNGGNCQLYINGTAVGSNTSYGPPVYNQSTRLGIGAANSTNYLDGILNAFNGYIDDLRITKGVARYTSNFTPPTAPFPDF